MLSVVYIACNCLVVVGVDDDDVLCVCEGGEGGCRPWMGSCVVQPFIKYIELLSKMRKKNADFHPHKPEELSKLI